MKKAELIFSAVLVPLDFLMVVLAGLAAYFLRTNPLVAQYRPVYFEINLPFSSYFILIIFGAICLLLVFALVGLYKIKPIRRLFDDFPRIVIGVSAGVMALVFYIFLRQELFNSRFLVLAGWLLAIVFVSFGRLLVSLVQKYLMRRYHFGAHRVLVVGKDNVSQKVIRSIKKAPGLGYQLVNNFSGADIAKIKDKVKKDDIDEIILADPDLAKERISELIFFCENNHLSFKFVPNFFQTLTTNTAVEMLGNIPIVELKKTALDGWGRILKRVFDIVFSLLLVVVFSPLYLLIIVLIKLDSSGPVIYKDFRYGYRKKKFVFYKFRSMRSELCDGEFGTKKGNQMLKQLEKDQDKNVRQSSPLHKIKDDPRITGVGKILRKYSLDELPQFLNVLKGDMSLVGYRPHMSYEVEKYTFDQQRMFYIKPGITGLAQISGRSDLDFDEEVKLDVFYMEHWSLFLDLIILIKTPLVVLLRRHIV